MYIDYGLLGRRIAKRRKELGLRQYEVCEKADLNDKYLSSIENARSILSVDVLMKIASVLNVTPNYLLLGTEKDVPVNLPEELLNERFSTLSDANKKTVLSFTEWLNEQQKGNTL